MVIKNWEEAKALINRTNGKTNVFTSVYSFAKTAERKRDDFSYTLCDYETAIVDKLFFDFAAFDSYSAMMRMHIWLISQNILHRINFSGRKFHLFVFVKNSENLQYKADAVYNAQKWICDTTGLTYGQEDHSRQDNPDIDSKLMGNLAGVTRYPNTWNIHGKKFCICLNQEALNKGYEYIAQIAEQQQYFKDVWFGKNRLDMKEFDKPKEHLVSEFNEYNIPNYEGASNVGDEGFFPCTDQMIKHGGFESWFFSAVWLRDKGFTYKEADSVFKKYLGQNARTDGWKNDYEHAKHSDRTLETVYSDRERRYIFPSCQTLWDKGFCPGKCANFSKMYAHRNNGEVN